MKPYYKFLLVMLFLVASSLSQLSFSQSVLSPVELLGLERSGIYQLSPNGNEIIYSISTPRGANEKPGSSHRTYYKMNLSSKESILLFEEGIKGSSPQYSPDGSHISFTYKKEEEKRQVWMMPVNGGDILKVTNADNGVSSYKWHPNGSAIAYLSTQAKSEKEIELKKRGYGFIFYEENLKNKELFWVELDANLQIKNEKKLLNDTHVWDFEFSPNGQYLAFTNSEKNLTDQRLMFRKIQIMEISTKKVIKVVGNIGKLGNYAFNEEGTQLAFASALNINDHAVSQAFTYSLKKETIINLHLKISKVM